MYKYPHNLKLRTQKNNRLSSIDYIIPKKMNPNHLFFPLALFSLFLFLSPNKASSLHKSHKGCFTKVYAFRDSYMNTGNVHALAGHTFSATNKPINRLCDGSRVIDFVCEALSLHCHPTKAHFKLQVWCEL